MEALMTLALALVYVALAIFALIVGAVLLGVAARLVARGPSASSEAYARGESLKRWWHAENLPAGAGGSRLDQRLAMAGRRSKKHGTIMVEERAAQPSYGR